MARRKITSSETTLGAGMADREDRHAWITRRSPISPTSLGVRITKGPYGLVDERYDPMSTTVQFYFDKNGDLVLQLGQDLNPYLNRILVAPPVVRIPAAMLKFKSYGVETEANLYGDFVFLWGEQKRRISYFGFNVAAIGLFDGVDEVCMDGTFRMFRKVIGELKPDQGNLLPFFISGELDHGEQFDLFKRFTEESHTAAYDLGHRIDFGDHPSVTRFLSIDMGAGHDRAPTPETEAIKEARRSFNELFPPQ